MARGSLSTFDDDSDQGRELESRRLLRSLRAPPAPLLPGLGSQPTSQRFRLVLIPEFTIAEIPPLRNRDVESNNLRTLTLFCKEMESCCKRLNPNGKKTKKERTYKLLSQVSRHFRTRIIHFPRHPLSRFAIFAVNGNSNLIRAPLLPSRMQFYACCFQLKLSRGFPSVTPLVSPRNS